jgi:predicted TIM-barrel fold metal-dependent hydrolase
MRMEDMVITSIDDHAVEPPTAFLNHYAPEHRDEAPRIIEQDGKDVWLWNDTIYPTIGLNAVVGRPRSEYGMEPCRFDQTRQAAYDPVARVDDMNVNGVLASINFPTMSNGAGNEFIKAGLGGDSARALRAIRAWNDWHMLEWCAAAPGRFIPMMMLPLWDMDLVLAEVKRWVPHGVHAITFPDNPAHLGLPSVHNPYWEPLWKACCDHKLVINCHIGTGISAPHASDDSPIDAWITTMPMTIANSAADWLFAQFLRRYPDLRIALSEGGIGWVPYFLERADFTYEHHHEWTFSDFGDERPSELFKKHFITCFIDDQFGLKNLEYMNQDMVCYEADYPHSDSLWPNCPEHLWATVNGLDPQIIDKITHQNVFREYSFDPFSILGGREKCNVGHLRVLGKDVDVSPRANLGGLRTESMNAVGDARRPVTSGEIKKMFAQA